VIVDLVISIMVTGFQAALPQEDKHTQALYQNHCFYFLVKSLNVTSRTNGSH
jgi:hypothetical protein